jgi:peptidyl-prolyl cis-trans isomerase C
MLIRKGLFPLLLILLTGCSVISSVQPTITPTPTPMPPTPTPVPAAAVVNGEIIPLADYSASLQQLQAAQNETGKSSTPDEQKKMVLDDLISQVLLAQAAEQEGHAIDDAALKAKIDDLTSSLGGQDKLAGWIIANGYNEESFKSALKRSMLAAWQRDQLIAAVPKKADQVHARQILVLHEQTANDLYAQLQAGADFATLALRYDPLTGGDLGWFPRGVLTQPAVEDAAFSLKPGEYSSVIPTSFGYQLVQVIDRDPAHPLSPEALRSAQQKALEDWITSQEASASIQLQVP